MKEIVEQVKEMVATNTPLSTDNDSKFIVMFEGGKSFRFDASGSVSVKDKRYSYVVHIEISKEI